MPLETNLSAMHWGSLSEAVLLALGLYWGRKNYSQQDTEMKLPKWLEWLNEIPMDKHKRDRIGRFALGLPDAESTGTIEDIQKQLDRIGRDLADQTAAASDGLTQRESRSKHDSVH